MLHIRPMWFHMGDEPGPSLLTPIGQSHRLVSRRLAAWGPDCEHAEVAGASVVRWDGAS